MNYTEMLEKLEEVFGLLNEIRDEQDMHCYERDSCKYCMYKVSLSDIIPIENEARICLFHLSNILLSKIRGRIRKSMELNYHLERNQK